MVCHLCGCTSLKDFHDYEKHMKTQHAVEHRRIKHRPKAEVVADWEARNSRHVIDPGKVACPEGCRCMACFNTALDKLLAKSEEHNDASGTGSIVLNDLSSY